jgi:hypothetical protein
MFDCKIKVTDNIRPSFIDFMKTKYPHFNQIDSLEKLKIILNPDKEILPINFDTKPQNTYINEN